MHRPLGRRLFTGVAAVTAAAALATPAHAAGPAVALILPDVTVAAGGSALVAPILFADKEVTVTAASMTFELSADLDGVTLSAPEGYSNCTGDGTNKLTCESEETDLSPDGRIGDFTALTSATAKALDAKGTVKVTFKADGVPAVSRTVGLSVAEGIDLAVGEIKGITAKPGGSAATSVQVTNNSDVAAHGAAVIFDTDFALESAKQFANCFYVDGYQNACTFDEELKPGATYEVVFPYQVRKDTKAPGSAANGFGWLATGDWDDLVNYMEDNGYSPGDAGNGGKLALKELPTVSALSKQTDTNPDNNWAYAEVTVTGKNGTDVAAVGATASGAAGSVVKVAVGAHNNGPATIDYSRSGEPATVVVVTLPDGTSVASTPEGCGKAEDPSVITKPGTLQYACFTDTVFPAGTDAIWEFGLKINTVVPNAEGLVEVNPKCACSIFADDLNRANDVAKIVVNPAAGGQGGGLPITGPRVALYAGAGALLVAAGVLGLFLARRRKRFTA